MKNLFKLSPILLLALLLMKGVAILAAAPIACVYAGLVAVMSTKMKGNEVIEAAMDSVRSGIMVAFILMTAYVLAEIFMVSGVGAAVITLSIKLGVTGRTVAVVAFISTCLLSVATGTSWGTFAACAPIFLWLSHVLGGSPLLTFGAAVGGAGFGDNIGLISDTTIFSSGIQGVNVVDRVRHQGVWSLLCLAVSAVLFYVTSVTMGLSSAAANATQAISEIPAEAWVKLEEIRPSALALLNQVKDGVPLYLALPVVVVIVLAVMRFQTLVCLFSGIASAIVLGFIAGTMTSINDVFGFLSSGISGAGSWVVPLMMLVSAFGGIMNKMNAFEPIARFFLKISRNVRQLMTCNSLLCIVGNAALASDIAEIATIGPVIKSVVDDHVEGSEEAVYKLGLRNAVFSDAMGVMSAQLIPWHACALYYVAVATAIYPLYEFAALDLWKVNYMAIISVFSLLILTFTGLDRFIPLFKLPSEPDVRLVDHKEEEAISEAV